MKKILFPFVLFLSLLLSACSRDSNSTPPDPVQGQWKLVNVSGTFAGINHDFTPGLITWTFNPITQTVTVINNNTDTNKWDVLETGVYNYQFVNNPESPCGESLDINGNVYGCYSVTNGTLVIDQAIADGFAVKLVH
ncbi:hypothetical protein [Flavobacterium phycosphaerae]|uniref:hypothetical protein n=1 Tax=Flavobacterium phycosphaerae TaxID=2697515 RepID=UPI0013897DE9|nr:hypothetical protein [Flavobacterium phycosphaerae]